MQIMKEKKIHFSLVDIYLGSVVTASAPIIFFAILLGTFDDMTSKVQQCTIKSPVGTENMQHQRKKKNETSNVLRISIAKKTYYITTLAFGSR